MIQLHHEYNVPQVDIAKKFELHKGTISKICDHKITNAPRRTGKVTIDIEILLIAEVERRQRLNHAMSAADCFHFVCTFCFVWLINSYYL